MGNATAVYYVGVSGEEILPMVTSRNLTHTGNATGTGKAGTGETRRGLYRQNVRQFLR
jgi:hypothetical protein